MKPFRRNKKARPKQEAIQFTPTTVKKFTPISAVSTHNFVVIPRNKELTFYQSNSFNKYENVLWKKKRVSKIAMEINTYRNINVIFGKMYYYYLTKLKSEYVLGQLTTFLVITKQFILFSLGRYISELHTAIRLEI